MSEKPRLIVFDLDYTLWPFWVDTHHAPPFNIKADGNIFDSLGSKVKYFPEVPEILKKLQSDGYELAIASRTSEIKGAKQLVQLLDWDKYFKYKEIYPGCKVNHFKKFVEYTGYKYEEMLFFDDEQRNIIDCNKLGVTSILVENGVDAKVIETGLNKFNRKASKK